MKYWFVCHELYGCPGYPIGIAIYSKDDTGIYIWDMLSQVWVPREMEEIPTNDEYYESLNDLHQPMMNAVGTVRNRIHKHVSTQIDEYVERKLRGLK